MSAALRENNFPKAWNIGQSDVLSVDIQPWEDAREVLPYSMSLVMGIY